MIRPYNTQWKYILERENRKVNDEKSRMYLLHFQIRCIAQTPCTSQTLEPDEEAKRTLGQRKRPRINLFWYLGQGNKHTKTPGLCYLSLIAVFVFAVFLLMTFHDCIVWFRPRWADIDGDFLRRYVFNANASILVRWWSRQALFP